MIRALALAAAAWAAAAWGQEEDAGEIADLEVAVEVDAGIPDAGLPEAPRPHLIEPSPVEIATRVDATTTTIGAWHTGNNNRTSCDDNYGELLERLNVNGSHGNWVAGARLDASAYANRPRNSMVSGLPRPCLEVELNHRFENTLLPEKLWLSWSNGLFEFTAGDSYVSFGRGLALSLRKTDELGLDNTQRGLRAKINTDRFTGTLVAGFTNIGNLDESSGRTENDPNDLLVAGQADVRLFNGVRLGGHVVSFMFRQPVSSSVTPGIDRAFQERWLNVGPTFDAPRLTRWLGLYLEGIGQFRRNIDGTLHSGFGFYGNSTIHLAPFTILLEGKAYGDLAVVQPRFESPEFQPVQYTAPPTVERLLQEIEHPQANVFGGRVKVDYSINNNLAVFVNGGVFKDDEGFLDPDTVDIKPGTIIDPYLGLDARFGLVRVQATGGWRTVYIPQYASPIRSDGHLDISAVVGFGRGHSIEFHWLHLERKKVLPFTQDAWREGTLQLGYRLRPWFGVSGILDYTTEAGMPNEWYPGGTAEVNLTEASSIRLFVGSSRGGLKCVSGVCRIFPPFSGAKATVALRF